MADAVMIVHTPKGWVVKSADGSKNLGGPYASEAEAKKRLKQVEYFKMGQGAQMGPKKER